jgi:hypothetical protein
MGMDIPYGLARMFHQFLSGPSGQNASNIPGQMMLPEVSGSPGILESPRRDRSTSLELLGKQ